MDFFLYFCIMKYIIAALVFIAIEFIYFVVAKKLNIVDKPNERSSHSKVTLLGGGIVFYLSILYFSLTNQLAYPWFLLGLTLIAIVSYIDDLHPLPSLFRMAVQLTTVALVLFQFHAFDLVAWKVVLVFAVAVGTINIYNFMDGVNGMLAAYSLVVLGTLAYIDLWVLPFVNIDLIVLPMIAVGIFAFLNFRTSARCFSGDVGSIVLGCLVLYLIGCLIQATPTNNVGLSYLVFISVYLADGGLTILKRMLRGENILLPHREHLYETLCNEHKIPHLYVSGSYSLLQLLINIGFFLCNDKNLYAVSVALVLLMAYSAMFFVFKNGRAKTSPGQ